MAQNEPNSCEITFPKILKCTAKIMNERKATANLYTLNINWLNNVIRNLTQERLIETYSTAYE